MRKMNLLLVVIFALLCFLWIKIYSGICENRKIQQTIETLQSFKFASTKGDTITNDWLDSEEFTIFIYFHTHCDFCKFELKEIEKRYFDFQKCRLILLSGESMDTLKRFEKQYSTSEWSNLQLCKANIPQLKRQFGKLIAPTFQVYSPETKLLKQFNGATKLSSIINVIENYRSMNDSLGLNYSSENI